MATFCDKVTYNLSIKADVKALFAGEDGFSEPRKGWEIHLSSWIEMKVFELIVWVWYFFSSVQYTTANIILRLSSSFIFPK